MQNRVNAIVHRDLADHFAGSFRTWLENPEKGGSQIDWSRFGAAKSVEREKKLKAAAESAVKDGVDRGLQTEIEYEVAGDAKKVSDLRKEQATAKVKDKQEEHDLTLDAEYGEDVEGLVDSGDFQYAFVGEPAPEPGKAGQRVQFPTLIFFPPDESLDRPASVEEDTRTPSAGSASDAEANEYEATIRLAARISSFVRTNLLANKLDSQWCGFDTLYKESIQERKAQLKKSIKRQKAGIIKLQKWYGKVQCSGEFLDSYLHQLNA